MIPANHPFYPFPYNLEDRIKHYIKETNIICQRDIDIKVKKINDVKSEGLVSYELILPNEKFISSNNEIINSLKKIGYKLVSNDWINLLK